MKEYILITVFLSMASVILILFLKVMEQDRMLDQQSKNTGTLIQILDKQRLILERISK